MKMSHTARNVLYGYGAFCVVNWALSYHAARSGSPFLLGSAGLLSLNETLRKGNVLSYLLDPISAAEKSMNSSSAPGSNGTAVCVTAGGVTACAPPP